MENNRPKNTAKGRYWWGVGVLLVMNLIGLVILLCYDLDLNVFVFTVLIANIGIFGIRALYAGRHGDVLFSDKNFRAAEQAANAERVALYAFIVTFATGLLTKFAEGLFEVDDSVGDIGESVGLLILVTPAVTYLTSGYGKFRDIVREGKSDAKEAKVGL